MSNTAQQVVLDPTVAKGTASLAAGGSIWTILDGIATAIFGVPVAVVLAAFAGTFYGMGYREPLTPVNLWINILIGTSIASYIVPAVLHWTGAPVGLMAAVAAVTGWAIQFATPWLKKNRTELLSQLANKILPKNGNKGKDIGGDDSEPKP